MTVKESVNFFRPYYSEYESSAEKGITFFGSPQDIVIHLIPALEISADFVVIT